MTNLLLSLVKLENRIEGLVDFDLLTNSEMHELPTDVDTVVQELCTTLVQLSKSQKMPKIQEKPLSLHSQPTLPTNEQLSMRSEDTVPPNRRGEMW